MREFQDRIKNKRNMIEKNKLKCKEFALKDTMVICDRCKTDLQALKNISYESHEKHYCKCVFGSFRKISVEEAMEPEYEEDKDFVDLYSEIWQEEKQKIKPGSDAPINSFCECMNKHIVGIVFNQKYYLTDISQV